VLVMDATTTTKKKKKKKRKRERIKKVCVVVAHLHSRRVRGYLVAHPSSFFFSDGRREKDYDDFCVA